MSASPSSSPSSSTADPGLRRTLQEVLDAAAPAGFAVRLPAPAPGAQGIVMARHPRRVDVLLPTGLVRHCALDEPAEAITDPALQGQLLREALSKLNAMVDLHRSRRDDDRRAHAVKLQEIRDYAIDRFKVGDICLSGLTAFLEAFGLEAYEPVVRVEYTISGSYLVRGNARDAEVDAKYLRVDLQHVDNVVEESEHHDVKVTGVYEIDRE